MSIDRKYGSFRASAAIRSAISRSHEKARFAVVTEWQLAFVRVTRAQVQAQTQAQAQA